LESHYRKKKKRKKCGDRGRSQCEHSATPRLTCEGGEGKGVGEEVGHTRPRKRKKEGGEGGVRVLTWERKTTLLPDSNLLNAEKGGGRKQAGYRALMIRFSNPIRRKRKKGIASAGNGGVRTEVLF